MGQSVTDGKPEPKEIIKHVFRYIYGSKSWYTSLFWEYVGDEDVTNATKQIYMELNRTIHTSLIVAV
jgi:hypothetical protein